MKKILIFILSLFLLVGIANALTVSLNNPFPSGNVSTTVNANFSISTVTNVTGITFVKTDLVGSIVNISSSSLTFNQSTPFNMLNQTTTYVIASVAIPSTAYAGAYTGSVNVTDSIGNSSLLNLSLTVQSINAMSANPTASLTSEADASRTTTLIITNTGSTNLTNINITGSTIYDEDNDTITLSYSPNNFALAPGGQRTVTITADIDQDVDPDDYIRIISINDTSGASASSTLTVKVLPEDVVCSDGEAGDLILSIDNPDSNDEFKPGESISVETNVENNGDDDINAYVEAFLYDKDKNKVIASVKSDKTKINDGDDKDFDLSLKIPVDVDEDNDRYAIYIKTYESGNEDDQCEQDDVDIDIEKDDDSVLIEKLKTEPSTLSCGGSSTLSVSLFNAGSNDQEDVRVRARENTLKLDQYSNFFDLDEGDDVTKTFTVTIPQNVTETTYYIEITVYDESGDSFDSGLANLTVSGSCKAITTTTTTSEKVTLSLYDKTFITTGNMFNIPAKITNTGDDAEFVVELSNIDDWATSTARTVFLNKDQSTTVYVPLQPKSGVAEGNYSATVNVKSGGKILRTDTAVVEVKGTSGISFEAFKGISTNSLFWIIGDIILVIIAVLFIRFIFVPRK